MQYGSGSGQNIHQRFINRKLILLFTNIIVAPLEKLRPCHRIARTNVKKRLQAKQIFNLTFERIDLASIMQNESPIVREGFWQETF